MWFSNDHQSTATKHRAFWSKRKWLTPARQTYPARLAYQTNILTWHKQRWTHGRSSLPGHIWKTPVPIGDFESATSQKKNKDRLRTSNTILLSCFLRLYLGNKLETNYEYHIAKKTVSHKWFFYFSLVVESVCCVCVCYLQHRFFSWSI